MTSQHTTQRVSSLRQSLPRPQRLGWGQKMHSRSNSVVGGDKAAARLTFRRGRRAFGMLARTNTSISERPKCQKNMLWICIFRSKSMHVMLSANVESNASHLSDPIYVLGHLRVHPRHRQLLTTHSPAHLGTSDCVQQNLEELYEKSPRQ